jgi:hypothetical protein
MLRVAMLRFVLIGGMLTILRVCVAMLIVGLKRDFMPSGVMLNGLKPSVLGPQPVHNIIKLFIAVIYENSQ